jgi:hypothetical protein
VFYNYYPTYMSGAPREVGATTGRGPYVRIAGQRRHDGRVAHDTTRSSAPDTTQQGSKLGREAAGGVGRRSVIFAFAVRLFPKLFDWVRPNRRP